MKITLGTTYGLLYLHEDSSPYVMHWDFKSNSTLLEDNFTTKVLILGLARIVLDEKNKHVPTCVRGIFGYSILATTKKQPCTPGPFSHSHAWPLPMYYPKGPNVCHLNSSSFNVKKLFIFLNFILKSFFKNFRFQI